MKNQLIIANTEQLQRAQRQHAASRLPKILDTIKATVLAHHFLANQPKGDAD